MLVRDAMNPALVTVAPHDTLHEAAARMAERHVGSAVVLDEERDVAPGIVTERDILRAVASGEDPATTRVADRHTANARTAPADWTLDEAVAAMLRGGFRHLVVVDSHQAGGDETVVGVVSMRDVVRAWVGERRQAM